MDPIKNTPEDNAPIIKSDQKTSKQRLSKYQYKGYCPIIKKIIP